MARSKTRVKPTPRSRTLRSRTLQTTSVKLAPTDMAKLDGLAVADGTSRGEEIRRAIAHYLAWRMPDWPAAIPMPRELL